MQTWQQQLLLLIKLILKPQSVAGPAETHLTYYRINQQVQANTTSELILICFAACC
jgi:hypothetical protein